jgi:hypothetical protein
MLKWEGKAFQVPGALPLFPLPTRSDIAFRLASRVGLLKAGSSNAMKKNRNWSIWMGFLFVLAAVFSFPFFIRFPSTRDFPWVNLLLFAAGGLLLFVGLRRAFAEPEQYRGKISGSILAVLSLLVFAFFVFGDFYLARQLPASASAPRIGQRAPDFTLLGQDGKEVTLSTILSSPDSTFPGAKVNGVLLIFYRGFW